MFGYVRYQWNFLLLCHLKWCWRRASSRLWFVWCSSSCCLPQMFLISARLGISIICLNLSLSLCILFCASATYLTIDLLLQCFWEHLKLLIVQLQLLKWWISFLSILLSQNSLTTFYLWNWSKDRFSTLRGLFDKNWFLFLSMLLVFDCFQILWISSSLSRLSCS